MQVEPLGLRVVRVPAIWWRTEGRLRAAVNRPPVQPHPLADVGQRVERPRIELATPGRPDVQQDVPTLRHGVNDHADEQLRVLPIQVVPVVAPGAVQRLARLPDHRLPVRVQPTPRHELLRRAEVLLDLGPVVDQNVRLNLAHRPNQPFALPVVLPLPLAPAPVALRVGEVQPQDVERVEQRDQLAHLVVQVLDVLAHVALCVGCEKGQVVRSRMDPVHRELRVVPVNQRVIEADLQPRLPERLHPRPQQIAPRRRIRRFVVGELAVPEAEAVVVLARDDRVFHAGTLGGRGPLVRVVEVGVEVIEVRLVVLVGDLLALFHPLVARRHRVDAPVSEQAEPIMNEPLGLARRICRLRKVRCHRQSSSLGAINATTCPPHPVIPVSPPSFPRKRESTSPRRNGGAIGGPAAPSPHSLPQGYDSIRIVRSATGTSTRAPPAADDACSANPISVARRASSISQAVLPPVYTA